MVRRITNPSANFIRDCKSRIANVIGGVTLFLAIFCYPKHGYAQEVECKVEFGLNSYGVHDFSDTFLIKQDTNVTIFLFNDCIVLGKQKIHVFKNVRDYSEITLVKIGDVSFLYIYPVYLSQVGPYTETLRNGIIIKILSNGKVKKINGQSFYGKGEVCAHLKKFI